MIKLIDNFEEYDFSSFENDIFFQRIFSDYKTLSCFNDVMFYACIDEDVSAVISKVGGNVTLSASKNAPLDEIREFLNVTGFSKILCDNEFSEYFKGRKEQGMILKIQGGCTWDCKANQLYSENLKDMFALVKNVFGFDGDYFTWVADLSHRMRHNSAHLYGIYCEDKLISGAFSLFETEKSTVISSVATLEEYRHQGLGESVVKTVIAENNKDCFVFTEIEKTENWYKNMGFVPCKMWSEIENVL